MLVSRRDLLGAAAAATTAAAAGLVGCSPAPTASAPTSSGGATMTPPSSAPTPAPSSTPTPTPAGSGRTLLAFFSRAGENYWYGDRRFLTTGNTKRLADMISDQIDCDVFRIEAGDPYPERYDPTVARNSSEQDDDARPRIADPLPDLSDYDTVLLGSPIWNVRPPMIMSTFVEAVDLTGKTLRPFVTYAVSGLGSTLSVYQDLETGARLEDGLAVQGEEVADHADAVDRWLRAGGLL